MKLICFHLFNDYSGSPKMLKSLLCGLLKQGTEVELITSKGGVLDEIESERLKRRAYNYKFHSNAIVALLRYTVVQIYTFFVALGYLFDEKAIFYINTLLPVGPALAGRLTGKRVIYHYHENAKAKGIYYRVLAWLMQRLATEIICVSKHQSSLLARKKKVFVVPNAVEDDFIAKLHPAPEEAFDRKQVLMLGSLKPYKGIKEFITLAGMLPQYTFELVLNETPDNIDRFLQKEKIEKSTNLTIFPRQNDVSSCYNRASLVLNLTNKDLFIETFGLTALEAMSAGLPVIVPTVGGIAEMVVDGKNGFKINVHDLTKIAKTIENILSNRRFYISLGNEALAHSKLYSSGKMTEQILNIIKHGKAEE